MNPSQVASNLRSIALKIENSKNPSRKLVARDVRSILARIRIASVEFNRNGKTLSLPWSDADIILEILGELGAEHAIDWMGAPEIPENEAAEAHGLLENALKANEINLTEVNEDPMGRKLSQPMEIPTFGGTKSLSGYWKETLDKLLDLLA